MEQTIGRYRMQLIAVVESAPSRRQGCREAGIHHSTYYDWLSRLRREGVEGLTPRTGRTRMLSPARLRLEAEVVALSLANPPWGPDRLFDELRRRDVAVGSASQVWRILRAHELNTRGKRFRLIVSAMGLNQADETLEAWGRPPRSQRRPGRLAADKPGDLVQFDCFHLGTLKEARLGAAKKPGVVWQYTAIDVASSFVWAELATTAHNPAAVHTTALAHRVAQDLASWGWHWEACSTDRGNEFVDHRFGDTMRDLGVEHRFIAAGRPQSNGKVEQVQNTLLQELWKPAFVGYTHPSITALRADLEDFLGYYNTDRPHRGKWNQGKPPAEIIIPNSGNTP
ncbi:MAG: integrase core domain-containing protein [Acidimicrobiia bacterium]